MGVISACRIPGYHRQQVTSRIDQRSLLLRSAVGTAHSGIERGTYSTQGPCYDNHPAKHHQAKRPQQSTTRRGAGNCHARRPVGHQTFASSARMSAITAA